MLGAARVLQILVSIVLVFHLPVCFLSYFQPPLLGGKPGEFRVLSVAPQWLAGHLRG